MVSKLKPYMSNMMLWDSTLKSLTPSVNAPLVGTGTNMGFGIEASWMRVVPWMFHPGGHRWKLIIRATSLARRIQFNLSSFERQQSSLALSLSLSLSLSRSVLVHQSRKPVSGAQCKFVITTRSKMKPCWISPDAVSCNVVELVLLILYLWSSSTGRSPGIKARGSARSCCCWSRRSGRIPSGSRFASELDRSIECARIFSRSNTVVCTTFSIQLQDFACQ